MWRRLVCLTLIGSVLVAGSLAVARENKYRSFDRLATVQRFVDEIYPGLKGVRGLVFSRAVQFHLVEPEQAALGGQDIDIVPCYPGSGVAGGGFPKASVLIPSLRPEEKPEPPVRYCTGLFLSGFSEFLSLSVGYSAKFPIRQFAARGSFVDGKSLATKQEIANHQAWTRQEMVEAVKRAGPRFGPDQKDDFAHSLPTRAISQFTGCALNPSKASFWVDRLEVKPDPVRVEIEWVVTGQSKSKGKATHACRATFEPFEGRLLTVQTE